MRSLRRPALTATAIAAALVVSIAGCTSGPTTQDMDAAFDKSFTASFPSADADAIEDQRKQAHKLCEMLDKTAEIEELGVNAGDLLDAIAEDADFDADKYRLFTDAAVSSYCPEHLDRL